MTQEKIVLSLLNENNGYLTTKEALKNNVSGETLRRMLKRNLIDRVSYGLYVRTDIFPDRFFIAQFRCSKGVFSHLTALYLHGYSDRDPVRLTMTVPKGANTKSFKDENIIFYYSEQKRMKLGLSEIVNLSGMKVSVYDIERTICDCIKYIDKLDRDLILTGLKRYLRSDSKDSMKLLEYATELNIRNIVHRYLEVL